ncbi:MAG: protein of unknown function DUF723 [Myoviridae sp. ctThM1]|nr:MAG: protein of unknown function DUF723 [Myoviridae sp. ctThM1]
MLFGRLTVIEPAERSVTPKGRQLARWSCSCKCGGTINVLHDSLKSGKALTCGCVPPDYVDTDFNSKSEVFIHKAKQVHGDKYDYTQTTFRHSLEDIIIVCPQHGAFKQKPSNHLLGSGCAKCGGVFGERNNFIELKTIGNCPSHGSYDIAEGCLSCFEEDSKERISTFLEKAYEVHLDKYGYSEVFFEKLKDKVCIICPKHGKFSQAVNEHLGGQGCPECGRLSKYLGTNTFIERSLEVHGNRFDYSLVVYEHSNTPVDIICSQHGIFRQKPSAHMNGQKCPKCAGEERAQKQHWNYIKRCELNEELGASEGVIYLLEMQHDDEKFLKVGISSNFKRRLGHYREDSIAVKVLKEIKSTALQTGYWEKEVLKLVREMGYKYIPIKEFKGWTECAIIEAKDFLISVFDRLENEKHEI